MESPETFVLLVHTVLLVLTLTYSVLMAHTPITREHRNATSVQRDIIATSKTMRNFVQQATTAQKGPELTCSLAQQAHTILSWDSILYLSVHHVMEENSASHLGSVCLLEIVLKDIIA